MDIKADLCSMRDQHDSDVRMTFAAATAAVLGVVALIAKGFCWFSWRRLPGGVRGGDGLRSSPSYGDRLPGTPY